MSPNQPTSEPLGAYETSASRRGQVFVQRVAGSIPMLFHHSCQSVLGAREILNPLIYPHHPPPVTSVYVNVDAASIVKWFEWPLRQEKLHISAVHSPSAECLK